MRTSRGLVRPFKDCERSVGGMLPTSIEVLIYFRGRVFMSQLENIESGVRGLSTEELAEFRAWFAQFDAEVWDRQFEADVKSGKLDNLAKRSLRDHNGGRSTEL